MTNPSVTITRHRDHLLVEGIWVDYGDRDKHEPRDVPWSLRVPTLRHHAHLIDVLLHPGVEPTFDPGELEMNGVEDARNLMHLNWDYGAHDEPCELQATAGVCLEETPCTGLVTLYGWLRDRERLGLARMTVSETVDLAARLKQADVTGFPDGEWVVGAPWFPDRDDIRAQAEALNDRVRGGTSLPGDSSSVADGPRDDPWAVDGSDGLTEAPF